MVRRVVAGLLFTALLAGSAAHAQTAADEGVALYRAGDFAGAKAALERLLGRADSLPRGVRIRARIYDALARAAVGDSAAAANDAALALAEEPCLDLSRVADPQLSAAFDRLRPASIWCGVRPGKAALVAAILPGFPQFLLGRPRSALLEGIPSLGGVIAGAFMYAASARTYRDYRAATTEQTAVTLYSSARLQRGVASGLLLVGAAAWVLNVRHAHRLAAARAEQVGAARHFSFEIYRRGEDSALALRAAYPIGGGR